MDIKKELKKIPDSCGVYIMRSARGAILYIGKAVSLKKRVASYFRQNISEKNQILISKVRRIDYIECASPEQALILEAALIKEKKPKYNISLKDNKSYPYIKITKEKYPRVFIVRPKNKKDGIFFGPYTDVGSLEEALKSIRRVFPFCSCRGRRKKKTCLYCHLNLCPGPCAQKISLSEYNENIRAIKKILKGKRPELIFLYQSKMKKLALSQKYEKAAQLRNKIYALENIYKHRPKMHQLILLKEILGLGSLPLHIEAIDVSALGCRDATGSVVVFRDGVPDKSSYRKFLIKKVDKGDDYLRVKEVVLRRYIRLVQEKKELPNLILIDGGRGQIKFAQDALARLGLDIPLVGLAKKNEEIWLPGRDKPLVLPKDNPGLHLLQRVRDEAHRFARSYHLLRRKKRWKKNSKRN